MIKITELATGLEGLNEDTLEEMQHCCEEAQAMVENAIPIVEQMRHSQYSEILGTVRRLDAKFTCSQAFRQLIDKLVDDYVKDTTRSALHSYRDHKLEQEITVKNAKLLDEACNSLQQIFDEEVQTQLKHPFLIKNMIAKDEALYESLQTRISEIIKDVEIWRNSYNSEADSRVMLIKEIYRVMKIQLDEEVKLDKEENLSKLCKLKDLETQNGKIKLALSKSQKHLKRLSDDLKTSQEREENYKQRAHILSSNLEDQAAKYSQICSAHKDDLVK